MTAVLLSEACAQFLFLRLAIFLQPADLGRELFFERFQFVELPRHLRFRDLLFQKQLSFRDLRLELRIDFGELFLLIVGKRDARLIFLQPFHR